MKKALGALVILLSAQFNGVLCQPETLADQEIIFDQPPQDLGLSQRSINCMLQDREGFLWIGSWEGLIRYDGQSTTLFQADHSSANRLTSNKILTIFEDRDGILWIGTHTGGLFRYDRDHDSFLQFRCDPANPGSLSDNNVWSIEQDEKGYLWIGTEKGLNKFDPATGIFCSYFTSETDQRSISNNFITDLHIDPEGRLWAASEDGINLLIEKPGGKYEFERFYYQKDGEFSYLHNYAFQIVSFKKDGKTIVFWSTMKGLKRLQDGKIDNFKYEERPSSFSFFRTALAVDHHSRPLVFTGSETGFNIFDVEKENFVHFYGNFDQKTRLSHNTVLSLLIDDGGVLWVGTKKGINKFNTYSKNFERYPTYEFDQTKSIITGIQGSSSGGYWISTMGGGLFKFKPAGPQKKSSFERFSIQGAEQNNFFDFVQTLFSDGKGNVWVGTAGGGVYHFNERKPGNQNGIIADYSQYSKSTGNLSDDYVMSIAGGKDGAIWIGTWSGGLNRLSRERGTNAFISPELKSPVVTLYEDQGTLWVGLRGGGFVKATIKNDSLDVQSFRVKDGRCLSSDFINCIFEDHAGGLWVGSEGGLDLFDRRSETFKNYPVSDNFNSGVVVGMLEDKNGRLWLSHWNGLTEIDPSSESLPANHYDVSDRIQGAFFYNNVCFRDEKGFLLFGGSNGFNIINPSSISRNPVAPLVAIKSLQVFNQPVKVGQEFNGRVVLKKSLKQTHKVCLKYFENSLSFEFASLHFAAPEKNMHQYILEGFDQGWQNALPGSRYAGYTNLPPGEYVFKVRATNNDGVWSDVEMLNIVVSPPWWKTPYAFGGYILVILAILIFFRQIIIMRANFINRLRMEVLYRENIEKMNKAKLQFFTNISHEFRTPLTLILGPLDKIINAGEGGRFLKEQLGIVNRNAQRLLRLINQLMDFRKIEDGSMKLEVAEGNIVKFIREIKLSFDGLADELEVDFSFQSPSSTINLWFDRDQMEKVFYNLLSNAFKHIRKKGRIGIRAIENAGFVTILIEDNGKGIRKDHLDKIFKMFFSGEDHIHAGTGIGLALTRSLVEMHHGTIDVESEENVFTRFTITLPKGRAHFDPAEIRADFKNSEYEGHYRMIAEEPEIPGETVTSEQEQETGQMKKILIVEDNAEVRKYIRSIFCARYTVLEASDGHEGLAAAVEELPDLIVSDIMMPGMDGITLCKKIKGNVKTSHIPVILVTARTSMVYTLEGLEKGADDYIKKPFHPKELELKARNILKVREQLRKLFVNNEALNIEPQRITLTSIDEKFIRKALDSIERNMANSEYGVIELSRDVGFSRMQLYRKLKAMTGMSTNEFVRNIRLKRAAQLIEQDQLTIAEVTYEVGFTDLQYFRSCFKKQFGVNPSEYGRNKNKKGES